MKDALAERLLAKVMGWAPEDVARERPVLQAMASYKYDEYQQFSPGMRFIESLALWLSQFKSKEEKLVAYDFVMKELIFCSEAEMNHLVSIAYPDHIRPLLIKSVAVDEGLNERYVVKVARSVIFKIRQRQCLFLGLSDGAHIASFRRYNRDDLSHEQILQTYEISPGRVNSLLSKLRLGIESIAQGSVSDDMCKFRTIVLLDDFSASGISYLRKEGTTFEGKIAKFYESVTSKDNEVSQLVDIQQTEIFIVLYMATEQARQHIKTISYEMWEPFNVKSSTIVVYPLYPEVSLKPDTNKGISELIDTYYDSEIEDEHTKKGGIDLKYGFAGCGLPLILNHNTPNNSLSILWAKSSKMRPLFPRISRH